MDRGGSSDPYVKLSVVGDDRQKFETKTQKKQLSPVWSERFRFENIPITTSLHLKVMDADRLRDEEIGSVDVPLASVGGATGPWDVYL
jgi:Ca2+-dependent lipid-binding protein